MMPEKKLIRNKKIGKNHRVCILAYLIREVKLKEGELKQLVKLLTKLTKSEVIMLKEKITLDTITEEETWKKERLKNTIRKILEYNLPKKTHLKQVKRLEEVKEALKTIKT